jgi:hypothetical protein
MNLFDILKQFKNIEPDPAFAEKSKRAILASPQNMVAGIGVGILRFFETGVAVVLAGFFIMLITGGFAGQQSLAPVQYSVIDPQGLRAEAQAVDLQIRLLNVNYSEVTSTPTTAESTPKSTISPKVVAPIIKLPASTSTAGGAANVSAATSTPTSTLSIDETLQQLSH